MFHELYVGICLNLAAQIPIPRPTVMRILQNTEDRLALQGTPGSVRWIIFCTLLGITMMVTTAWFGWVSVEATGSYFPLLPLGIGFLMGTAFFLIGLITITVGRMRLEFDRSTGQGSYDVFSPIIDVGKSCSFRLESIDSVTLERHQETRPDHGTTGNFPAKACRARLRIRKPRRAIVLDETQNGREDRVRNVANTVAKWLAIEVTQQGK